MVDATACLLWGNRAAETFFGRTCESAGRVRIGACPPRRSGVRAPSLLSRAAQVDSAPPIELRLLARTGWRLVEFVGAPLRARGTARSCCRSATSPSGAASRSPRRHRQVPLAGAQRRHGDDARLRRRDRRCRLRRARAPLGQDPDARGRADLVDPVDRRRPARLACVSGSPPARRARRAHRPSRSRCATGSAGGPGPVRADVHEPARRPDRRRPRRDRATTSPTARRSRPSCATRSRCSAPTLDSTADGILVVDREGRITSFNQRFAEMWRIPDELLETPGRRRGPRLRRSSSSPTPRRSSPRSQELYAQPEAESHDMLEFKDGRVFERYSMPQRVDGESSAGCGASATSPSASGSRTSSPTRRSTTRSPGLANQALFRDRVEHALARLRRARRPPRGAVPRPRRLQDRQRQPRPRRRRRAARRPWPTGSRAACARPTPPPASAATSSRSCSRTLGRRARRSRVAERMLAALQRAVRASTAREVFVEREHRHRLRRRRASSCDQLLRNADLAMYTAKGRGKGRFEVFEPRCTPPPSSGSSSRPTCAAALERGELVVALPADRRRSRTGRIVGVEALVRWQHPSAACSRRDAFIPLAEETGLIVRDRPLGARRRRAPDAARGSSSIAGARRSRSASTSRRASCSTDGLVERRRRGRSTRRRLDADVPRSSRSPRGALMHDTEADDRATSQRAQGARRAARGRRLRHRLLVAQLPAAVPGRHPQDRPVASCDGIDGGRRGVRAGRGDRPARADAAASRRSPRASRRAAPGRAACASSAASSPRATCSPTVPAPAVDSADIGRVGDP